MKTLREYIDQLDEIDRRGFLKGMGAAAVAGATGGLSGKANAQAINHWVKYATDLAIQTMRRPAQNTGYDLRNWLVTSVSNWVTDYCLKTNSYNAKDVIDYCNQQGLEASGLDKQHALVTAFLTNMKDRYQDFLNAYRASITDKMQEFNQAIQSQKQRPQQQSAEIAPIFKPENANLNRALSVYYYGKESNQQIAGEMAKGIAEYITATNQKDFVNASFKEIKKILDNMKSANPEQYEDLKNKYLAYYKTSLQQLKQMSDSAGPEFKESVAEQDLEEASPDAVKRIEQLVRYK